MRPHWEGSTSGEPMGKEDTHEGLSLTCLVNVRTLRTGPKVLVMASRSSSGKLGGRPLMYTLGGCEAGSEGTIGPFPASSGAGWRRVEAGMNGGGSASGDSLRAIAS